MIQDAQYWIRELQLIPHPEGGYYRVTYRSSLTIASPQGERAASTAIYFLLEGQDFSAFHCIASDELWHFYTGSALIVYVIDAAGNCSDLRVDGMGSFQAVVHSGCWFASRLEDPAGFALVGCTVAPGFDFADFKLAKRVDLIATYPQHQKLIEELTRE